MTGSGACAEIRLELGVYVLGVIGAGARSAVDAHLAWCAECRDELAELAGLPRLLSRAEADETHSLVRCDGDGCGRRRELSADLGHRCLPGIPARYRRHGMWLARTGLAGACLIAGAGAIAACGRQKVAPYRTCRAVMGLRGGDSAR